MSPEERFAQLAQMCQTGKLLILMGIICGIFSINNGVVLLIGILLYLYGRIRAFVVQRNNERPSEIISNG